MNTKPPSTRRPDSRTHPSGAPSEQAREVLLRHHLDTLICVRCGAKLEFVPPDLRCTACKREFAMDRGIPILLEDEGRATQQAAGPAESLFRFPSIYRLKHDLLQHLNKTNPIELSDHLRGQRVLDVGCGPFSYGYDRSLPRSIAGLDLSPEFVQASAREYGDSFHLVASANRIPFADKTFDTALLRFVIHHIPGDTRQLLREVARVTRRRLIIFDHVRSDLPWQSSVQTTYWKMFDSGHHYNTVAEWEELLRPYRVLESRRSGLMFGNVCHIALDLEDDPLPGVVRAPLFGPAA
jgi:SAM-dependent methyltransferase